MNAHATVAVLLRWLLARRTVQEQMYAARIPVIRAQLQTVRGTAW